MALLGPWRQVVFILHVNCRQCVVAAWHWGGNPAAGVKLAVAGGTLQGEGGIQAGADVAFNASPARLLQRVSSKPDVDCGNLSAHDAGQGHYRHASSARPWYGWRGVYDAIHCERHRTAQTPSQ